MKKTKSTMRLSLAMLGLSAALCMPAAQAGTITVTGSGLGSDVPMIINGDRETSFAGQLFVNLNGQSLIAYCVDLFRGIDYTTYSNTTGTPAGYSNGQRAAWALENYGGGVSTNQQGTALQLALWDIVHDGGDGLATGSVRLGQGVSNSLRTAAQAIVAASAGHSSNNAIILYNNDLASGARMQTLITSGPVATPEPATYGMIGAGLLIVGALRRRR